jgi:hypothetical protein
MRIVRRLAGVALTMLALGPAGLAAGQAPAPPRAALTPEQMETFLLEAAVVGSRPVGSGVTGTLRLTLADGALTHDAQAQFIDEDRAVYRVQGYTEFNFRDCFCYNIAAYRLARLLGIDNVPMSVERRVDGKRAAVTWWIDDVAMDEEARRKKGATDPDARRFEHYRYRQRLFDELIQNRDRNLGNLLYTTGWTMWMIDHTRAFRLTRDLGKPEELLRVDRTLYANLKKLAPETLASAVGPHLNKGEVEALIARRDAIVKLFEAKIAKSGEGAALYTYP